MSIRISRKKIARSGPMFSGDKTLERDGEGLGVMNASRFQNEVCFPPNFATLFSIPVR